MKHIFDYWALILLSALSVFLLMLIFDTSWPVAYVYVVSTPSGAEVSDNNGFVWKTPARIPVQHDGLIVTVSHSDRVPVDTLLLPEMLKEPVLVSLPYRFQVTISSEPSGASVVLDRSFSGYTPFQVNIDEPGIHHLNLTLENLIVVEDSFTLLANDPESFHYVLPRLHSDGMVFIPPEACIPIDIRQPYLMARYEVTNSEFCEYLKIIEPAPTVDTTNRWGRSDTIERLFPGDYPLPFYIGSSGEWVIQNGFEDYPVAGMTFRTAEEYCTWLSSKDSSGISYRLPTEEEWYAAAMAGSGGPWPWGSRQPDGNLLNLSDRNEVLLRRHPSLDDGYSYSSPVGSFPCNNWGLCDMAGNVWEYCRPVHPDSAVTARGGSWLSSMDDCRCEARMYPDTVLGFPYIGFRIAASIELQE